MLGRFKSTTKDVLAGSLGVSRSTVSASKPMFYVLKTVNAWTAKTLMEVKKEGLSFMKITIR